MNPPNTVPIDRDLLASIEQALKACNELPFNATHGQTWNVIAKCAGVEMRLQLWLKHAAREVEHG
jgi:hypothetical protein